MKGVIPVVSTVGDIKDRASIEEAFRGVTCVIHCAAHVSYEFPPNKDELHKNNVEGRFSQKISYESMLYSIFPEKENLVKNLLQENCNILDDFLNWPNTKT